MCNDFGYDSINYGAAPIVVNPYGSYFDTTTQIAPLDNSPNTMQFNSIDIQNGISLDAGTRFKVLNNGVYNLQFSAQLYRTAGGSVETIDIWLRKNGLDVPDSNTRINIQSNSVFIVAAWNWYAQLNAGQFLEIMWSVTDTNIQLQYDPPNLIVPFPAIPSIIATISKVS